MISGQDVYSKQCPVTEVIVFRLTDQASVTSTPTGTAALLPEGYQHGLISRSATGIFKIDLIEKGSRILGVLGCVPTTASPRISRVTAIDKDSVTITFNNLGGAAANSNFNLALIVFRKTPVY